MFCSPQRPLRTILTYKTAIQAGRTENYQLKRFMAGSIDICLHLSNRYIKTPSIIHLTDQKEEIEKNI